MNLLSLGSSSSTHNTKPDKLVFGGSVVASMRGCEDHLLDLSSVVTSIDGASVQALSESCICSRVRATDMEA